MLVVRRRHISSFVEALIQHMIEGRHILGRTNFFGMRLVSGSSVSDISLHVDAGGIGLGIFTGVLGGELNTLGCILDALDVDLLEFWT